MPVRRFLACAAGLLMPPTIAHAGVLWDNGPLVPHPAGGTSGIAGQPLSRPQAVPNSSLTSSTPGINATAEFGMRVAENFTVPAGGWDLDSVVLFAYQSSQSTPSVSNVRINLWTIAPFDSLSPPPLPDPLPQPILSTPLTLAPTSAQFVAYRQLGTSSTSSASRPVFAYTVPLDGLPNGGGLA
ncbi:MAG TPA: hypothetical protein PKB10_10790, partial [Tepidisphaeraceae bacterium]|nr:hypothetical protein [Tepidisphaeraceae bacterium]